jgi:hypothetical protein
VSRRWLVEYPLIGMSGRGQRRRGTPAVRSSGGGDMSRVTIWLRTTENHSCTLNVASQRRAAGFPFLAGRTPLDRSIPHCRQRRGPAQRPRMASRSERTKLSGIGSMSPSALGQPVQPSTNPAVRRPKAGAPTTAPMSGHSPKGAHWTIGPWNVSAGHRGTAGSKRATRYVPYGTRGVCVSALDRWSGAAFTRRAEAKGPLGSHPRPERTPSDRCGTGRHPPWRR